MLNELERSQALSDEEAMNDYINGNSDSYDLLYRRHSPGVLWFIIMFLSISKILAEDLLQEIFMKVIVNRSKYMPSAKFTTWLYAIARYHCIDYIKTEQYRKHRSLDTPVSGEEGGATVGDFISRDDETQEDTIHKGEIRSKLAEGLETLKEEFREVYILSQLEGMQMKEIAVITNTSENTVKSRLRYAFRGLREEFKKSDFFELPNKAKEV